MFRWVAHRGSPSGVSLRVTSSRLADLLQATHAEARRLRHGGAAAAATGLVDAVAHASASALSGSASVLLRRAATKGKPLTYSRQYTRYCRDVGVPPWPVTLSTLQGWIVWRLATISGRTRELYKATGTASAVSWLRRFAEARGAWRLSARDERDLVRTRTIVPACVPATRSATRVLSTEELVRVSNVLQQAPPSAHRRLARSLLAHSVFFQARFTELYRAQMRDQVMAPAGLVLAVVFGKVAGDRSEVSRHLVFAPHTAGALAHLCPTDAYRDLVEHHVPGYEPAWHQDGHPQAERPLFGLLAGEVMTAAPLLPGSLVPLLAPFFERAGVSVAGLNAHFGRATGGSLLEFGYGLTEDTVALMAGRGVAGSVYRTRYRNIRRDAGLFARHCGQRVAAASGPYAPRGGSECCDE